MWWPQGLAYVTLILPPLRQPGPSAGHPRVTEGPAHVAATAHTAAFAPCTPAQGREEPAPCSAALPRRRRGPASLQQDSRARHARNSAPPHRTPRAAARLLQHAGRPREDAHAVAPGSTSRQALGWSGRPGAPAPSLIGAGSACGAAWTWVKAGACARAGAGAAAGCSGARRARSCGLPAAVAAVRVAVGQRPARRQDRRLGRGGRLLQLQLRARARARISAAASTVHMAGHGGACWWKRPEQPKQGTGGTPASTTRCPSWPSRCPGTSSAASRRRRTGTRR